MKASIELAISLGSVSGAICLALALAYARFRFRFRRRRARGRAVVPVDPVHESHLVRPGGPGEERWFGGAYGLTPIATPGKHGWTASDVDGSFASDKIKDSSPRPPRESHFFSRASRALRKTKTGPRRSRTTELAEREGARDRDGDGEGEGSRGDE
ncbi:hypothetical protein JCM11491_004884 [Sporobolomyces phaffii]